MTESVEDFARRVSLAAAAALADASGEIPARVARAYAPATLLPILAEYLAEIRPPAWVGDVEVGEAAHRVLVSVPLYAGDAEDIAESARGRLSTEAARINRRAEARARAAAGLAVPRHVAVPARQGNSYEKVGPARPVNPTTEDYERQWDALKPRLERGGVDVAASDAALAAPAAVLDRQKWHADRWARTEEAGSARKITKLAAHGAGLGGALGGRRPPDRR